MVLAAGEGVRLRPLTTLVAKPVVPFLNQPLLHWTLARLAAAGVRDVVINLHHRPASVQRALAGRSFGLRIRYSHEPELLGTGGGLRRARRWLGSEPLLVVNGDVYFTFDLAAFVRGHRRSGAVATLALRPNPDPRRYSPVVTGPAGRLLSIAGKPRPRRGSPSLFAGVHVLDPALLERLPEGRSDSVRDLYLPLLAEGVRVRGARLPGAWYDLGRPELYRAAHTALLRRRAAGAGGVLVDPSARVHPTARLRASVVGRGCVIARGARVEGSVLWDGVRVAEGARVRNSVLARGARVAAGERLADCVAWRSEAAQAAVPLEVT